MLSNRNDELLQTLLKLSQKMNESRAVMPLLRDAVDISLELLHASHGFIILRDKSGRFVFPVARDFQKNTIADPESEISRKILFSVMDDAQPIITASAVSDSAFEDSKSVNALQIKSVLCVPLLAFGEVLGVLYIENRRQSNVFSKEQAQPLVYLAGHIALCIRNMQLEVQLEKLQDERVEELADTDDVAKAAREAVERTMEEDRKRLLSDFIRDTSHHFKTPLTVIKSSADLIKRKIDPTDVGDYLDRIDRQVNSIVLLIDTLNLLAKMGTDKGDDFIDEDLSLLVSDLRSINQSYARQNNIRIEKILPDAPVRVDILPDYARHAINNVIRNAIEFSPPGNSIRIEVVDNDDEAHVIISDDGIGMPAEELPNVTQRFYQLDKSGTRRGLGVGLSIARQAMLAHDGELRIESMVDEGTTVTLIFPRRKGD